MQSSAVFSCGVSNPYILGGDYRHSFNGMEKDDEIKGDGNSYDFGARIYDSRVGRWLSQDPMIKPYESPYAGIANNPILLLDPNGEDVIVGVAYPTQNGNTGHMKIYVTTYEEVQVTVIENGQKVTKTYYTPTGIKMYENMPGPGAATQSANFRIFESHEQVLKFKNHLQTKTSVLYRMDKDKGVMGSSFNQSLNPDIDPNGIYYEKSEVEAELAIHEKASEIKRTRGKYVEGVNDCSTLIGELLLAGGLTTDTDFGKTTSVHGDEYSYYTPNEIAKDLEDMGYLPIVTNSEHYKNVTRENAQEFIDNRVKAELEKLKTEVGSTSPQ